MKSKYHSLNILIDTFGLWSFGVRFFSIYDPAYVMLMPLCLFYWAVLMTNWWCSLQSLSAIVTLSTTHSLTSTLSTTVHHSLVHNTRWHWDTENKTSFHFRTNLWHNWCLALTDQIKNQWIQVKSSSILNCFNQNKRMKIQFLKTSYIYGGLTQVTCNLINLIWSFPATRWSEELMGLKIN